MDTGNRKLITGQDAAGWGLVGEDREVTVCAEDTHSQGSVCDVDVRGHLLMLATLYFDLLLHPVLTSWLDWLVLSPGVPLSPLLPQSQTLCCATSKLGSSCLQRQALYHLSISPASVKNP